MSECIHGVPESGAWRYHELTVKDCPYCKIDRLKLELEEAHEELAISIKERIDLGGQLTEARAELERWKVIKWVQTESYEAVAAVEQARRQGWEQGKSEAIKVIKPEVYHNNKYVVNTIFQCADAIDAMEYKEKAND